MGGEEIPDGEMQPADQILMAQVWRRRHVMGSVDDLVPEPVALREQQEIVAGESCVRTSR